MSEAEKIMQEIIRHAHEKEKEPPAPKEKDKEVNPCKMTRKEMIVFLNVISETFDNWVKDTSMPRVAVYGGKDVYHLGDVVRWRIDKAERRRKKPETEENNGENKNEIEPDILIKNKIAVQELRKKTRENDEADGLLCNSKQMDDKYFRLGRAIRDNLMSKDSVYGPQLNMVTGFEAAVYLRKEFEKFCNSIADLNLLDDESLAREYHEMFMKGFNYGKS